MNKAGRKFDIKKSDIIDENIEYLKKLKSVMEMIKTGVSETEACKYHNIDKMNFRHMLAKPKLGYKSICDNFNADTPEYRNIIYNSFLSWQETLACQILKRNFIEMPDDVNESVEYVLSTLPKQEQEIIQYIYRDEITYIEICNILDITAERVRQLRGNAEMKLRHEPRIIILKYGLKNYKQIISKRTELRTQNERNKPMNEIDIINNDKYVQITFDDLMSKTAAKEDN